MDLKGQVAVLAARRYMITDEKTGEVVDGTKITYVENWEGELRQDDSGIALLSAGLPFGAFDQFSKLPAIYDVEFELVSGARGKAMLKIKNAVYAMPFYPYSAKPAGAK